jgi:hypothetical protein
MSDHRRHAELGQVIRISGDVRAAGAPWEVAMQRALLEDGAALPGDDALLDRLCSSAGAQAPVAEAAVCENEQWLGRRWRRALRYGALAAALSLSLGALALGLHTAFGSRVDARTGRAEARRFGGPPLPSSLPLLRTRSDASPAPSAARSRHAEAAPSRTAGGSHWPGNLDRRIEPGDATPGSQ